MSGCQAAPVCSQGVFSVRLFLCSEVQETEVRCRKRLLAAQSVMCRPSFPRTQTGYDAEAARRLHGRAALPGGSGVVPGVRELTATCPATILGSRRQSEGAASWASR